MYRYAIINAFGEVIQVITIYPFQKSDDVIQECLTALSEEEKEGAYAVESTNYSVLPGDMYHHEKFWEIGADGVDDGIEYEIKSMI